MRVLLLSPHTDDVELGAGGLVIKLSQKRMNNDICWVVFSICEDAVPEDSPSDMLKREFLTVVSKLGIKDYHIYNFENMNFPKFRQEILEVLEQIKEEFKPELVICPSLNDSHQDHKAVSKEVVRAFKKNASIIGYEMPWNNLTFSSQLSVRLTEEQMEGKWELLSLYKSQFIKERNYFSKELIFSLARVRGIQCNTDYAEAFEVIRGIL